jgi:hypothetical protein
MFSIVSAHSRTGSQHHQSEKAPVTATLFCDIIVCSARLARKLAAPQ